MEFDLRTRYHAGYEGSYEDFKFYEKHGFHPKSFDIEVNRKVIGEISVREYEDLVFDGMPDLDGNLYNKEDIVTDYLVDEGFVDEGMVWSGMIY